MFNGLMHSEPMCLIFLVTNLVAICSYSYCIVTTNNKRKGAQRERAAYIGSFFVLLTLFVWLGSYLVYRF